jgi:hypothetical protein
MQNVKLWLIRFEFLITIRSRFRWDDDIYAIL